MATFGFIKVSTSDHDFAKFLRVNKAIDTWQSLGGSNTWTGPDGRTVALCIYSGVGGMDTAHWVREDLLFMLDSQ